MNYIHLTLRECRSYIEYFIIPAMAVIMPWWLTIRFFRLLAYLPFLYRENADACVVGAKHLNLLGDNQAAWKRACKVCQMVDAADVFLLAARGFRYADKYIDETLSAQLQDQQMVFFPHYGAGMWAYKLLFRQEVEMILLVNPEKGRLNAQSLLGRFRLWVLKRHGVTMIPANDMKLLRTALQAKQTILLSPDMPYAAEKSAYQIPTDLGRLNVMSRFFELAEKREIPILNCAFGLDVRTGQRYFDVSVPDNQTAIASAKDFAALTVEAIKKRPYLWRMMVMAPQVMLSLQETNQQ